MKILCFIIEVLQFAIIASAATVLQQTTQEQCTGNFKNAEKLTSIMKLSQTLVHTKKILELVCRNNNLFN